MNKKKKRKGFNRSSMRCPYCGSPVIYRSADGIYRDNSRGTMLYVCSHYPECDAYVRVHTGTNIPVGSIIAGRFTLVRMPVTIIPLHRDLPCYPQGITRSHTKKPSGSCLKRGAFPCQSLTGHYPDGRLTQVLSLLPIRLSSTEAIRNSRSGGVNFVRRRYTVPPLLRKSHPVINEEFCILLCTLRTRLQYMCFSDC